MALRDARCAFGVMVRPLGPRWARIAAPVSVAVIALMVVGGLTSPPKESKQADAAVRDRAAASTTTERQTLPITAAPATTAPPITAAPVTTAPPTTAAPTTAPPPPAPKPTPAPAPPPAPAPRAAPAPAPAPAPTPAPAAVSYPNCAAAKAAGVTPLYRGQPGYAERLDRDHDGVACES